jgi:hypothetical protein
MTLFALAIHSESVRLAAAQSTRECHAAADAITHYLNFGEGIQPGRRHGVKLLGDEKAKPSLNFKLSTI